MQNIQALAKASVFIPITLLVVTACYAPGLLRQGPIVQTTNYEFEARRDAVWDSIVDYLTQGGYTITTIDKASGFIHVERATGADQTYMICDDVLLGEISQRDHELSFSLTVREKVVGELSLRQSIVSVMTINLRTHAYVKKKRDVGGYVLVRCPSTGKFESGLRSGVMIALNLDDPLLAQVRERSMAATASDSITTMSPQAEDANETRKLSKKRKWIGGLLGAAGIALLVMSDNHKFHDERRYLVPVGGGLLVVGGTILVF